MSVSSSSVVHPFVTKFSPEEIEHGMQELKDIEVVFLHVHGNKNLENNHEAIGKISVGLQKVDHYVREFTSIEQCLIYIRENPNANIKLYLSDSLGEDEISILLESPQVRSVEHIDASSRWIKQEGISVDSQLPSTLTKQTPNLRRWLMHSNIPPWVELKVSEELPQHDFISDSCSLI
ncbi:unnamed protein product, partial [Rotaria sp. Silwood1]